jgi:hypothetical protein
MNEADIKLLQAQAISMDINAEILRALMHIQYDLRLLVERVESIEQNMYSPPGAWPEHDDVEVTNPPF